MPLLDDLIREGETLKSERGLWNTHWQDLSSLGLPDYAEFYMQWAPGAKRTQQIIESTFQWVIQRAAALVHQRLCGMGQRWLYLRTDSDKLNKDYAWRTWLDDVTQRMQTVFDDPARGFHTAFQPQVVQLLGFGTGPQFVGELPQNGGPYFQSSSLTEVHIICDDRHRPIGEHRFYPLTLRQVVTQFGLKALPEDMQRMAATAPNTIVKIQHVVRPRDYNDVGRMGALGFEYLSLYILPDKKVPLALESGFRENPYIVARWRRTPQENYGRCPAMDALPDVKTLQEAMRSWIKMVHKQVDPPLIVDDEGTLRPSINTAPGKRSYARRDSNGKWNFEYMPPPGNFEIGQEQIKAWQTIIGKHFFIDLLQMPEPVSERGSVLHMSATEAAGRMRQQMEAIGPIISNLETELLGPLCRRVYSVMWRAGMIPPPPGMLNGARVIPSFVSQLAVAARSQDADTLGQWINYLNQLAASHPEIWDVVDDQGYSEVTADALRVPMKARATTEAIQAIRQNRAALQQQQMDAQAQLQRGQAANQLAQARQTTQQLPAA